MPLPTVALTFQLVARFSGSIESLIIWLDGVVDVEAKQPNSPTRLMWCILLMMSTSIRYELCLEYHAEATITVLKLDPSSAQ